MKPPSGGPITGATSPGQVMIAMARIRPSLGVARSTASRPTGTIIAPPMPCSTRAAANAGRVLVVAHRTEAAVNTAIALPNTVRRPKRSAAQPLIGMNTASVSRYAVMPRLMSAGCTLNERAICGSAVAMMVPSRFSMKKVAATSVTISDEPERAGAPEAREPSGACIGGSLLGEPH